MIRFRQLLESAPDASVIVDAGGRILFANEQAERIFGYRREEILGEPMEMLLPDRFRAAHAGHRVTYFADPRTRPMGVGLELAGRRKDGTEFRADISLASVETEDGRLAMAFVRDVTKQTVSEHEVQASEARFKAQYKSLPIPTYTWRIIGDDFELIDYNNQAEEITNGHIGRLVGQLASEFYGDAPDIRRDFAACAKTRATIRREMTYTFRSTGESRELVAHYVFVPPDLVMVHTEDVSAQLRAERALEESEARYRSIFDNALEGIYQTTVEGRYLAINPALASMLGFDSPEEALALAKDVQSFYADPKIRRDFQAAIERDGEVSGFEYMVRRVDGTDVWVSENARALRDELGTVIGYEGTILDITERRHAELGRQEAEAKYRKLVEQVPAIVYTVAGDDFNTALYLSPHYEKMLGYTPEERLAEPDLWIRLLHPEDRDRVIAASRRSRLTGEPFAEEYRLYAKDDRVVWVRDEAVIVTDDAGNSMFQQGVMVDITALKLAEEGLKRSIRELRLTDEERRRLLSRLITAQEEERKKIASDIHDDPIQKMVAAAMRMDMYEMAHPEIAQEEDISKLNQSIHLAIESLRHLMFELRPDALDRDGLVSVLRLYLEEQGEQEGAPELHFESELRAEPPAEVRITLYRIAQEAVTNARKHAGASRVDVLLAEHDGGFLLRVKDDGVGFEVDSRPESPVGHLGLTSMRERAEMAGGHLTVGSRPGDGTWLEAWVPNNEAAEDAPSSRLAS